MGKRGPKPVEISLLNLWEFEFHKALGSLLGGSGNEGTPPSRLRKQELKSFISRLKQMTPEHYWLTTRRLSRKMGNRVNLARRPIDLDRWWAERERDDEILWMQRELNPPKPLAKTRRRKIWFDLVKADTYAAL